MVQKLNDRSIDGAERLRRRKDARRLEILHAASRVFREQGFAATGMREIAAEAELSPGNLYHYFEGKHEILFFCQDRSLGRMLDALEQARLSGKPRIEQLRDVLRAHVHCLLDEIEGSAAHLEVDDLPRDLRTRIVAKRDRYERGIRRLIADGVASGEVDDCDPGLVTRAMLGALNWTARWFRPDGARSAAEVADELVAFLVRGLNPAPSTPKAARRAARGGVR